MPRKNVKNAGNICLWKNCIMNSLFLEDLPESTPPPPPVFSYKEKTCGGGRFNFVRRKGIRMKHFIKK